MAIEFINQDISTHEGWSGFVQSIQNYLSKAAAKEEWKLADVTLILSEDPWTGEPLERPAIHVLATVFNAATDEESEELKRKFEFMVRTWAVAGKAIASIFTAEAWFSVVQPVDGKIPDNVTRPSKNPNRQEAIYMVVDHKEFGTSAHHSMITRANGERTLANWETQPGGKLGGRFAKFLPPEDVYKNTNLVAAARALVCCTAAQEMVVDPKERMQ